MRWIDAIKRVLQDEGQALHYTDITEKIVENNYRSELGATPAATVNSVISVDLKRGEQSDFIRVRPGEYYLKQGAFVEEAIGTPLTTEEELAEETEIAKAAPELISQGLVKSFGMFWSRDYIVWSNNPKMYGAEQIKSQQIDFSEQIGIYMLHDGREVIYVGQAIGQSIAQRLFQHVSDRLKGRWDRFSWFGFRGVHSDGRLMDIEQTYSTTLEQLADAMEGILIEGLEPRQNRRRGDYFGAEYIQVKDPQIDRQKMDSVFNEIKKIL